MPLRRNPLRTAAGTALPDPRSRPRIDMGRRATPRRAVGKRIELAPVEQLSARRALSSRRAGSMLRWLVQKLCDRDGGILNGADAETHVQHMRHLLKQLEWVDAVVDLNVDRSHIG